MKNGAVRSGAARVYLIPGVLERSDPAEDPAPVVFDSPHSGHQYPRDFGYALPLQRLRSAEDMYVDELFAAAPANGASLLRALFPRSYVDVNRHPLDIDASLLASPWPQPLRPGGKTRNGKGLLRSKAGEEPIYDRKLAVEEVQARLAGYYEPYHETLAAMMAERRQTFGEVWHVNCHSWTPPDTGRDGNPVRHVDFFLGDRDGTTCDGEFTELVAGFLGGLGYAVRVNRLFKGLELVRRHGLPGEGRHSLQIEINRNIYMEPHAYAKAEGYAKLSQDLTGLVAAICDYARARL